MALRVPDLTVHLGEMLDRTAFTDGGVGWLTRLVQRIVDESGLDAQIATNPDADRRRWNLEVEARGQSIALMDIVNVGPGASAVMSHSDLDRVLAKTFRCWQQITRHGEIGEIRPWIGVVTLHAGGTEQLGDELDELIRSRMIDSHAQVTLPRGGVDGAGAFASFASSLVGRLAYVKEALPAS